MKEEGIGKSLFTHSNGQSSNTFYDDKWEPEWDVLDKENMIVEIPDNVLVTKQFCQLPYFSNPSVIFL